VTLHVNGGAFTGNNGDSLRPAATGSSALNVSVAGGTAFADSNSGVNVSADQDADVTFDVTGSTFLRHASHALQMIVNDNASAGSIVRGTVANNSIGDGSADSGSHDANGISYRLGGSADVRLASLRTRSATPTRRASSSKRCASRRARRRWARTST